MKKILIILVAVLTSFVYTQDANAQATGFEKGHAYLDLGVGLPRYSYGNYLLYGYGYNRYALPYFQASFNYGVSDMFSVGAFGGFSHYGWKWVDSNGKWDERYTLGSVGGRLNWHIWNFLNNTLELGLGAEKLDFYASLMLGAGIISHSETTPNKRVTNTTPTFYGSGVFGLKYYFVNNLGLFIEGGYGSGTWGIVGISFKM